MNLIDCKKVVYEYFVLEIDNSDVDACHYYRRLIPDNSRFSWEQLEDMGQDIWYPVQHMKLIDELENLFQEWKLENEIEL